MNKSLPGRGFVLCAVLLSACAASFQAPTGPNVARLRLVSVQSSLLHGGTSMVMYPSGTCKDPMSIGVLGGIDGRLAEPAILGMPRAEGLPERTFVERQLAADQRVLFTLRNLVGNKSCVVSFSFMPARNVDYEARVAWDAKQCRVYLKRLTEWDSPTGATKDAFLTEPTCTKGLW